MTGVMAISEARAKVERVKASVSSIHADLIDLYADRAWLTLGYDSWDALCDAEFGVRLALPRDERRDAVGELRAAGLSTRAIGSALGVSHQSVQRDLSTGPSGPVELPERITSLDGRERPATRPTRPSPDPEPFDTAAAIARYPDLDVYTDRPDRIEALATALDEYPPAEREERLDSLAKSAAARRRGIIPGALTGAASLGETIDHAKAIIRALDGADLDALAARAGEARSQQVAADLDAAAGHLSDLAHHVRRAHIRSVQ